MTHRLFSAMAAACIWFLSLVFVAPARGGDVGDFLNGLAPEEPGRSVLLSSVSAIERIVEPDSDAPAQTFTATLRVVECEGLPKLVNGAEVKIAYQAPNRLRIVANVSDKTYSAGRDGNQLWTDEPALNFAVLGKPGVARFAADPNSIDHTTLAPFAIPISHFKISLATLGLNVERLADQKADAIPCRVLRVTAKESTAEMLKMKGGVLELWVRSADDLPARFIYNDGKIRVRVDVIEPRFVAPLAAEQWQLHAGPDEHVQTVAVSHLANCLRLLPKMMTDKTPALPPADGSRRVVATEGKGRLEMIDGARVLFLQGSPREMGHQHGVLLKHEIEEVSHRILYGVGVASSFYKGAWFFGEVEGAEARLEPFMDKRYLEEEDAIAAASGMNVQEARLGNFFPELFHCSGFALFGKATADGHIYHGRVLDYLRGVGLEKNAVTIIHQPDYGHAWINITYAGFVGTVTAMNDQGISIGEMGGGGYGKWDGKPMAHLMREVMEKASTLDEAVQILQQSPRTCQYYYVIADGKTHRAVGVGASPEQFVVIHPGEFHPLLPHPEPDTIMLSAGKRYETLSGRVKDGYGRFDADTARALMDPPVCMNSNIQSVLFEPDTLDVWLANADGEHVASETRYTHLNLRKLLEESKRPKVAGSVPSVP